MMAYAEMALLSVLPAVIGVVTFFIVRAKNRDEKFDSQVVNIQNGKSVMVEFKKDMTKKEIKTALDALDHLTR
jgi:hypothetical protein